MPRENPQITGHKRCIEIIEAMDVFKKRCEKAKQDELIYFKMGLIRIAEKNHHRAIISKMAYDRLALVYQKEMVNYKQMNNK